MCMYDRDAGRFTVVLDELAMPGAARFDAFGLLFLSFLSFYPIAWMPAFSSSQQKRSTGLDTHQGAELHKRRTTLRGSHGEPSRSRLLCRFSGSGRTTGIAMVGIVAAGYVPMILIGRSIPVASAGYAGRA